VDELLLGVDQGRTQKIAQERIVVARCGRFRLTRQACFEQETEEAAGLLATGAPSDQGDTAWGSKAFGLKVDAQVCRQLVGHDGRECDGSVIESGQGGIPGATDGTGEGRCAHEVRIGCRPGGLCLKVLAGQGQSGWIGSRVAQRDEPSEPRVGGR
jgi:hypothetical protein